VRQRVGVSAPTLRYLTASTGTKGTNGVISLLNDFPCLIYLQWNEQGIEQIVNTWIQQQTDHSGDISSLSSSYPLLWRQRKPPTITERIEYMPRSVSAVKDEIDGNYHGCYVLDRKSVVSVSPAASSSSSSSLSSSV
jgi:hypothetical protein